MAEQLQTDRERAVLDLLRPQYEEDGYVFIAHPSREVLPSFLQSVSPDAIALKANKNVCIEVKSSSSSNSAETAKRLARIIEGKPDWTFRLVFVSDFEEELPRIALVRRPEIDDAIDRVHRLEELGFHREAFISAWIVFEASFRNFAVARGISSSRPFGPLGIISALQEIGHVPPHLAKELRSLAKLRTAVVHGDFAAQPQRRDTTKLINEAKNLITSK